MIQLSKSLQLQNHAKNASDWIIRFILPAGWILLLTGMFWIGTRPGYHKLFYACLAAPTLLALALNPSQLRELLKQPLTVLFLIFSGYILLTVLWAGTESTPLAMAKRPLYILMLIFSAALIFLQNSTRIERVIETAAIIATLCIGISIAYFFYSGGAGRFSGYRALYNPLLTAHVLGFFFTYWLCRWHLHDKPHTPLILLALCVVWIAIILTGSRTPLVAMFACLIWLTIAHGRPRLLFVFGAAAIIAIIIQSLNPDSDILVRGASYRPAIWMETLKQISESPWLGLGYTHPMVFWVDGLDYALADPHNIELGVLFCGGIIGLTLWMSMYAYAAFYAWQNRKNPAVLIASTLVVFGFTAGLTEGSAFFSRPKEHWFLIWIPLALLASTRLKPTKRAQQHGITEKT